MSILTKHLKPVYTCDKESIEEKWKFIFEFCFYYVGNSLSGSRYQVFDIVLVAYFWRRDRVAFISISWENRRRIKAKALEIYQISKLRTENMASVGIIAASRRPKRGRTKWKKCQTLGNGSNGSMISMHGKLFNNDNLFIFFVSSL